MSTNIPGQFAPFKPESDLFSARAPISGPLVAPQPAAAPRRRLHNGHFAFMRAIVQGVDLQQAWDRYLRWEEEGGDARAMRGTIAWLRDEFAAAARREARFGTARLVLIDAAKVPDEAATLPALEAFVEQRGLEDFPQAEQIALFEAEFGRASQRQRRRARLIGRQLDALNWIEQQVAQPPRPADSIAYWLNPLLVAPLQQAGLDTLGALQADIAGRGPHWFRRLRGVGETKAARIQAWLAAHRASLGVVQADADGDAARASASTGAPSRTVSTAAVPSSPRPAAAAPGLGAKAPLALRSILSPASPASSEGQAGSQPSQPSQPTQASHAGPPRSTIAPSRQAPAAPSVALRPLDRLDLPPSLDGRAGPYRRPPGGAPPALADDLQAIAAWLAAPADGQARPAHTRRAYHREAERFLLWCVIQRSKPLSSVDGDDCQAYRAFLVDPQPRARWCVQPSPGRQSPLWRPFSGPLGAAGQRQAVAALSSLFSFLVGQRYVWGNPWRDRRPAPAEPWPLTSEGSEGSEPATATADATIPRPQAVATRANAKPARAAAASPRPLDATRSLSPALWAGVLARADALPPTAVNLRLRFALRWLYATGSRLSESVAARLGDLRHEPGADGQAASWWLQVGRGAGGRVRELPVPDGLIADLREHLSARGLDPDPAAPEQRDTCVLGRVAERGERARRLPSPGPINVRQGVSASTLARQLKQHFGACAAARAEAGDAEGARQLAAASAHWLRHTHARHLLAHGLPLALAQQHLGHASRSTTAAYLVPDRAPGRADWQTAWDAALAAGRDAGNEAANAAKPADTEADTEAEAEAEAEAEVEVEVEVEVGAASSEEESPSPASPT